MNKPWSLTHSRPVFWAILGLAIAIRVFLLPIPNTNNDFFLNTWSRMVTVEGFHTIYNVYDPVKNPPRECQYPPGYLYVLWLLGNLYQLLFSREVQEETIRFLILLRIPTVLADLALGVVIFRAVGQRWGERAASAAFAAYVLSPALILDSTIVTQIDSVHALLTVGTILLLVAGKDAEAIACLALAAFTKLQAVILAPLVFTVVARRGNWRAILLGGGASVAIVLTLSLPFILYHKIPELLRTLLTPVGTLPFLSANAYNLWWLASLGNKWQSDTVPILGILTPRILGLVMMGTAAATASCRVYFDRSRDSIILSAAFVCFSFYFLCTEMTERYVLVVLPFFLLIAPSARKFTGIYLLLSVTAFINLYMVFPLLRISPWDALNLPHSNILYYRQPNVATKLPQVFFLDSLSPTILHDISIGVSVVHLILLGYIAITVSTWRQTTPIPQDVPDS